MYEVEARIKEHLVQIAGKHAMGNNIRIDPSMRALIGSVSYLVTQILIVKNQNAELFDIPAHVFEVLKEVENNLSEATRQP